MKKCEWDEGDIPVIDLFAGPGGLGEGFSSVCHKGRRFRIGLSVEMDKAAHQTLELRSFFRQFKRGRVPQAYYDHLQGKIDRDHLFDAYPQQACTARFEACHATMGEPVGNREIANRLSHLGGEVDLSRGILIGGPPCQAYSMIGRARRSRAKSRGQYRETQDGRHVLYRQYLRVVRRFSPAAFVMENVPGILSSEYKQDFIFDRILRDLRQCGYVLIALGGGNGSEWSDEFEFVLNANEYGVPQTRSRIFVVGVRDDRVISDLSQLQLKSVATDCTVGEAIADLPNLRSRLSEFEDSADEWQREIRKQVRSRLRSIRHLNADVASLMADASSRLQNFQADWGGKFVRKHKLPSVPATKRASRLHKWLRDDRMHGVVNHETRKHQGEDLARYMFLATWGKINHESPKLMEWPPELLPNHKNTRSVPDNRRMAFADRYRVQLENYPARTITSHICKDGNYFVHYDPAQCRSLTVREAARIQTFPDNYLFCGSKTAQYQQVGNAVPPYLAAQIAKLLFSHL